VGLFELHSILVYTPLGIGCLFTMQLGFLFVGKSCLPQVFCWFAKSNFKCIYTTHKQLFDVQEFFIKKTGTVRGTSTARLCKTAFELLLNRQGNAVAIGNISESGNLKIYQII